MKYWNGWINKQISNCTNKLHTKNSTKNVHILNP